MKAEMTADGIIKLLPETGAEAFALRHWTDANEIPADCLAPSDGKRYGSVWRGSGLIVQTYLDPNEQERRDEPRDR